MVYPAFVSFTSIVYVSASEKSAQIAEEIDTLPFSRPIAFFSFSKREDNLVREGDNNFSNSVDTSFLNLSIFAALSEFFVKVAISRLVSFRTPSLVRSAPIKRISKTSVDAFCSALVLLIPFEYPQE